MTAAAETREEPKHRGPWASGVEIPTIPSGTMRDFIIAMRRSRSGKVYSFPCAYLNAYQLEHQYCPAGNDGFCDGCEDGCPTTGWFQETGNDGDGTQFDALTLYEGDEIVAWRPIPQWGSEDELAAAAAPDMLAALRESVRQLDTIIADGTPTDWQAWRNDLSATLAKAEGRS